MVSPCESSPDAGVYEVSRRIEIPCPLCQRPIAHHIAGSVSNEDNTNDCQMCAFTERCPLLERGPYGLSLDWQTEKSAATENIAFALCVSAAAAEW